MKRILSIVPKALLTSHLSLLTQIVGLLLFMQGIAVASIIDSIEVKGISVPLIYEEQTRLPMVSMQLVFRSGGSITDNGHAGLAKLSAKMMNEGTLSDGSIGFAKLLDSKAIQMSAHTGTETFVFELGALKEEFGAAAELLGKLLSEPNLTEESLQKTKAVTVGSLTRKENDYDYVAARELKALLYEGTPLAQPPLGTVESVKAIGLNDVRSFLNEHLVLSRAMVVIGGDIGREEAKKRAAGILSHLERGSAADVGYHEVGRKAGERVLERETEQAYLYFGAPYAMQVGDEEEYKARVATYILGAGGFGSRLMEEIRVKRGLAYSAYARVGISKSHSYFSGYLQTKTDSLKEARETVEEVIADFVKEGVTEAELEQAKRFLLGSEPLRVETLSQRLNRTFLEYYKGEEIGHSKKELEKIRTLELGALNDFIKKHREILELSYAIVTDDGAKKATP
jgi:predicted Zn-dependent peptidase